MRRRCPAVRQDVPRAVTSEIERPLNQATDRVHLLKQTLVQVDAQIRALKLEAIQGDLLTLQRDLSLRAAAIVRLSVAHGCPAAGKQCRS